MVGAYPHDDNGAGVGDGGADEPPKQDESKIFVKSEESPDRILLETRITKDDGYQKQQGAAQDRVPHREHRSLIDAETLIVRTDSSGVDMALSFQEAEGCAAIWSVWSPPRQRRTVKIAPEQ